VATAGWTPAVVLVQRQWRTRLGLALGIAGSGVGLGIFLVVPLCQALIDTVGWRWAFRALAALCVLWILPATYVAIHDAPALPREPAARRGAGEPGAGEHALARALGSRSFRLIGLAVFRSRTTSRASSCTRSAWSV
jgi:MFS family permease